MTRTARRFGRGRKLGAGKRAAELAYDIAYVGGWPSRLARPLGLQGALGVSRHELALGGAPASGSVAGAALRIAFAADFHSGPSTHPALLVEACRALAGARADLLLLAGDFVGFHARYLDRLLPHLAAIEAPLGKLAVLGNHDLIGDEAYIAERLAEIGIRTLVNANVRLTTPIGDLWVCGLDDEDQGVPDAAAALAGAGDRRIVLMHSPQGLAALEGHAWSLAFCGHVHGGQFWIAGRTRLNYRGEYNRRYLRGGVFQPSPGRTLLVTRGLGQTTLPLRVGADPEVHVCVVR